MTQRFAYCISKIIHLTLPLKPYVWHCYDVFCGLVSGYRFVVLSPSLCITVLCGSDECLVTIVVWKWTELVASSCSLALSLNQCTRADPTLSLAENQITKVFTKGKIFSHNVKQPNTCNLNWLLLERKF